MQALNLLLLHIVIVAGSFLLVTVIGTMCIYFRDRAKTQVATRQTINRDMQPCRRENSTLNRKRRVVPVTRPQTYETLTRGSIVSPFNLKSQA